MHIQRRQILQVLQLVVCLLVDHHRTLKVAAVHDPMTDISQVVGTSNIFEVRVREAAVQQEFESVWP